MSLSRTVSDINGDFSRKSLNFPPRYILCPRWRGFLGIRYRRKGLKTRVMGYRAEQEVWRYAQPCGYNPPTWHGDRQTDRQTTDDSKDRTMQSVARVKTASTRPRYFLQNLRFLLTNFNSFNIFFIVTIKKMISAYIWSKIFHRCRNTV